MITTRKTRSGFCIIMTVLLIFSSLLPTYAQSISDLLLVPECLFDGDKATDWVNAYAGSDQEFSLNKTKHLKNASGDYAYTIAEMSPWGYAVFYDANTRLVEVCYTENVGAPIPIDDKCDYYYVGPGLFAVQEEGSLRSVLTGEIVSTQTLQDAASFENRMNLEESLQMAGGTPADAVATYSSTSVYSKSVGDTYFPDLNDHGENNKGTCTVLAAAMLLGYYDHNICDSYIATEYTTSESTTSSAGTTESFHQLLCDYVYGDNAQGGIYISDAAVGINAYLSSRSIPVTLICNTGDDVQGTKVKIVSLIDHDHPAIVSMAKTYGASVDHTVLVYGYKYISSTGNVNYDTLMYRVHYGWSSPNDAYCSSAWFYQYGHITDCAETGTHCDMFTGYTYNQYHSGNYHYYERKNVCCSCGRIYYDWDAFPCNGNCVIFMSMEGVLQ